MQDKLCFKLMLTLGKVNLQRRLCRIFGSQIIIIIIIIMIIYIYIYIYKYMGKKILIFQRI